MGDALGAAVEFQRPGQFAPVVDYRGGGPHGLGPGEWTDDTSMALALADSIAVAGWDLDDQARRYLAWWRRGEYSVIDRCFDIGRTTMTALMRFERTGNARESGDRDESAQRKRFDHAFGAGPYRVCVAISRRTSGFNGESRRVESPHPWESAVY